MVIHFGEVLIYRQILKILVRSGEFRHEVQQHKTYDQLAALAQKNRLDHKFCGASPSIDWHMT